MTVSDFPNTWPSINMDFRNSKQMDPRIPFTRASTANTTGNATGDVNGEISTFPENVPRLTDQGLLLEKESTNYIENSNNFNGSDWSPQGATISTTANQAIAPDGTNTAQRVTVNTTNIAYYSNSADGLPDVFYQHSCYFKADTASVVQMGASGASQYYANFDLSDGTLGNKGQIGTPNLITSKIEPVGNGWYRCIFGLDLSGGSSKNAQPLFTVVPSKTSPRIPSGNFTGSVFAWGYQMEHNDHASSYIATSGSEITRAADFIQVPIENFGNNFLVNGPGTFVCTASKTDYVGPSNQVIFTLDGRPMEPAFGSNAGQKVNKLFSAGADSFIIPATQSPIRETFVGSVQQTPAICNRAVGPGQSSSDTAGSFWPSTVNDWYIGNYLGNNTANPFNGWIERIAYYPVVMDLDQVEALAGL